jgi:hypothetical protein
MGRWMSRGMMMIMMMLMLMMLLLLMMMILLHPMQVLFFSNRSSIRHASIPAGEIVGLTNGTLDEPWGKLVRGKQLFADVVKLGPEVRAWITHKRHEIT